MTAATLTLVEFLLARIAEDNAAALTARKGLALLDHKPTGLTVLGNVVYEPARALAECEAKRRIVEEHKHFVPPGGSVGTSVRTLAALAAVYADHPDCRDEWRP